MRKISFVKMIQVWGLLFILGGGGCISVINIVNTYYHFNHRSDQVREKHIASQKYLIKQEVERVVALIAYEKLQREALTRKRIKSRVDEALAVAENIYNQNKNYKDKTEIQKMIFDALRGIRFEKGAGYYFVTRVDGVEMLFADKPELEGVNLLGLQDTRGKYVVQDMIRIVQESGEGFYDYYWTKPQSDGGDFKKISFVKIFKPYNWFIGTGLYAEDVTKEIQAAVLSRVSRIRFGKEGYIFINNLNGDALVANGRLISGHKKLWEVFNKNPEKTKAIFAKEYNAAEKPDGDYIYYSLNKLSSPNRQSPKTSFVYGIPDWQWLVGAGVYLDDVDVEIANMQAELKENTKRQLFYSLLIVMVISVCAWLLFTRFLRRFTSDLNLFKSFFKRVAVADEPIDCDLVSLAELESMAQNANKMLADKIQAEKQLEMFKTFAESCSEGMGWVDLHGKIIYFNSALAALVGEENRQAYLGKNVAVRYYPVEEQKRLAEHILPEVLKNGSWSGELLLQKRNGDLFSTQNSLFLILDKKSEPLFFANIVTDISEQKKAQLEKEVLTAKLNQAKKMETIGLMAGGVAHDLNNILSGIVGYPELLLESLPENSNLQKPLLAIQDSGQRAALVVADLLTVARGIASPKVVMDINDLVQEYFFSPECEKLKSLDPAITYDQQLHARPALIHCSPVHVKKCIMNLVINGAEAILNGGSVIVLTVNQYIDQKTGVKLKLAPGDYVLLSVLDTGPGISSEDIEHIFEPFYSRKKMGRSGTGLGLSVVWNTMQDHDGTVIVESHHTGTSFHLYFPLGEQDDSVLQMDGPIEKIKGRGEHILVVDDELQLRDLATQMLDRLGYQVSSVSSGERAIEFAAKQPVDLILLDMLMEPGINGRQTYEEIKKLYPRQKAIIVSGFSKTVDIQESLEHGVRGFIKKPYSMEELSQAVRDALNSKNETET